MTWAVVALNHQSIERARTLKAQCANLTEGIDLFTISKYVEDDLHLIEGGLRAYNEHLFKDYRVIIYIMAMGIVVRDIAPWMKHKSVDPAVLCMSIDGAYIIPVLSGHLGGANKIARLIGQATEASPVITTASDLLGKPAVDLLAQEKGLVIGSFKEAKDITAMLINSDNVQVYTDTSMTGQLGTLPIRTTMDEGAEGMIYIGYRRPESYKKPMVQLIPKTLTLGVGARRDTPFEAMKAMLTEVLGKHGIDRRAIGTITSIDLKKDEAAIIRLAETLKVPFKTYTAEALVIVEDQFETSEFVKKTTGVGAVAMTSGYLGSGKGQCIIEKVAGNGMTMCLWEDKND